MNRLVLIGNGFDLAHNLPTSYQDFINWYWNGRFEFLKNCFTSVSKAALCDSCGNSDRTLLNTLFEHKNCVSIKPYYYKWGEGEKDDNYIELVQNISRNFTDMKLMRDRVVNKTYCEPLTR